MLQWALRTAAPSFCQLSTGAYSHPRLLCLLLLSRCPYIAAICWVLAVFRQSNSGPSHTML